MRNPKVARIIIVDPVTGAEKAFFQR